MTLIGLVIMLAVVGVLLYLLNNYVPMIDPKIKTIINVVVVIVVILWLLQAFGVLGSLDQPIPRLR